MYLGNSPTQQAFTPAVDVFSGNGSTTAFTLSRPVAAVSQVQAFIENVPQSPVDAFTVSGNTITFTSAPPSGSSNIYVRYTSPITQVMQPTDGSVGTNQLAANAVTAAKVASGQVFALNGVAFPATQVPSADANTLDDYEEGTWTPVWGAASGGSMGYAAQIGRYVKVGRLVTATCHVITSANNALSGSVYLAGLPFTSDSTGNNYVPCAVHVEQVNIAASAWVWAYVAPNSTVSYWRYWSNNGPAGNLQGSMLNAASDIMITCSYITT